MKATTLVRRKEAGTTGLSTGDAWAAVLGRDRAQDGAFVYGVRTTGVYCRPSCPSRRPRETHVSFFGTPADAEDAGYRPCRRCRPHAASGTPTERSVTAAREYLDSHAGKAVTLERLGRAVGLSPAYLQRAFTRLVGVSPKAYQDGQRRAALKARLREGDSVTRATFASGLGSASAPYRRQGRLLGVTPGAYRRGGSALTITYGIVASSLGRVLVGATERGVCVVTLGERAADLERLLGEEFPAAHRVRDDRAVAAWARGIIERIDRGDYRTQVPLDLQGTTFQLRVWQALQEIPVGETRTYAQVAAEIGRPSAARAVARACATNHASLVVPCHRVIAANGKPNGYRWGIERKRALLATEQTAR